MDIVERLSKLDDDSQKVLRMTYYEIKRLREALEYFACDCEGDDCQEPYHDCGRVARDALGEKE